MSDSLVHLVTMITSAFADGRTVPPDSMVYENDWETEDLVRDLTAVGGRPDERFIGKHFGSPPAFTAEGLRHVLPQYLIYSLRHPRSDATERVIFHLAPDDMESEYWRERLAILSPAEKFAICEYLRYMQVQLAGQHYDEYFERALSAM